MLQLAKQYVISFFMHEKVDTVLDLDKVVDNYSKVERETVESLKVMLQEVTKKALEQKLFEGHYPFPSVEFGTTGILYNVATFESGTNQSGYGADHLVLTSDGKLIQFRVVGDDDGDGEWTYEGRSGNEAEPRQYLDWAPNLVRKIQKDLSDKSKGK